MREDDHLIGKEIDAIYINGDKTSLRLHCGDEWVEMHTDADCCSESWIEHMTGIMYLRGREVTGIERMDLGEAIGTRQECDQLYSLTIQFGMGECAIEFRNSSNGYYGGWMSIIHCKNDVEGYTQLTKDF